MLLSARSSKSSASLELEQCTTKRTVHMHHRYRKLNFQFISTSSSSAWHWLRARRAMMITKTVRNAGMPSPYSESVLALFTKLWMRMLREATDVISRSVMQRRVVYSPLTMRWQPGRAMTSLRIMRPLTPRPLPRPRTHTNSTHTSLTSALRTRARSHIAATSTSTSADAQS